jgi:hypothetical protein
LSLLIALAAALVHAVIIMILVWLGLLLLIGVFAVSLVIFVARDLIQLYRIKKELRGKVRRTRSVS